MDVKGEKTLVLSRINQSNTKKEARKSFLIYEWLHVIGSAGSRPWDKGGGGGGGGGGGVGVGAVSKKIFPPFEPQFGHI